MSHNLITSFSPLNLSPWSSPQLQMGHGPVVQFLVLQKPLPDQPAVVVVVLVVDHFSF